MTTEEDPARRVLELEAANAELRRLCDLLERRLAGVAGVVGHDPGDAGLGLEECVSGLVGGLEAENVRLRGERDALLGESLDEVGRFVTERWAESSPDMRRAITARLAQRLFEARDEAGVLRSVIDRIRPKLEDGDYLEALQLLREAEGGQAAEGGVP